MSKKSDGMGQGMKCEGMQEDRYDTANLNKRWMRLREDEWFAQEAPTCALREVESVERRRKISYAIY